MAQINAPKNIREVLDNIERFQATLTYLKNLVGTLGGALGDFTSTANVPSASAVPVVKSGPTAFPFPEKRGKRTLTARAKRAIKRGQKERRERERIQKEEAAKKAIIAAAGKKTPMKSAAKKVRTKEQRVASEKS